MNVYRRILIIVFIATLAAPGYAQEDVRRISMDKAVELSLQASEDYRIAANEVDRRNEQYKQARSGIYPQAEAGVTWTDNFEYPQSARPTVMDYSLDAGVSLSQLLWSFGKVSAAISFADKYADIGRMEKEASRYQVVYTAKVSYWSVVLARNTHRIIEESLENSRQNKALWEKISAAGRGSRRDMIKMDADIASRIPRENEARAALGSVLRRLKVLIGFLETDGIELIDEYPTDYSLADREKYVSAQEKNEPTLKVLRRNVEAQEDLVKIKRAGYYPTIAAFAGWNEKGIGDDPDLYAGDMDGYGVAGVKFSVPLWTGGALAAELEQSRIDRRNARLRLRKTEKQFSLELENSICDYREYINTLSANRQAVETAKESFELTRDLFSSGQASAGDLNDAELLLTGEKLKEQTTLYNINVMLAKMEKLAAIE